MFSLFSSVTIPVAPPFSDYLTCLPSDASDQHQVVGKYVKRPFSLSSNSRTGLSALECRHVEQITYNVNKWGKGLPICRYLIYCLVSKCNHRYLRYVNLKIILHHVVPLRQKCINSIISSHIWNNGALKTNPNRPASLGGKGSSVCPVSYMHEATQQGRHASRRLSTSAIGEKIGRYQPFFRKAMSKMFILGKRHILLFYAEDKNRMCISIWKGK